MKAKVKSVRIAPRKMAYIADEVRGKTINKAITYLKLSPRRRAADTLYQLIKSAVANADQKGTVDVDKLYIKTLMVGEGPKYKRFKPRAKGSASPIWKRTSHVTVFLEEQASKKNIQNKEGPKA